MFPKPMCWVRDFFENETKQDCVEYFCYRLKDRRIQYKFQDAPLCPGICHLTKKHTACAQNCTFFSECLAVKDLMNFEEKYPTLTVLIVGCPKHERRHEANKLP